MKLVVREKARTTVNILPNSYNAEKHSVTIVWSTGARYFRNPEYSKPFYESLSMDEEAVDLTAFRNFAPVLDIHGVYSLDKIVGRIEEPRFEDIDGVRSLLSECVFDQDHEPATKLEVRVAKGFVRQVSLGYERKKVKRIISSDENTPDEVIAEKWKPYEGSFVVVAADGDTGVRSADPESEGMIIYESETIIEEDTSLKTNDNKDPAREGSHATRSFEDIQLILRNCKAANIETDRAYDWLASDKKTDEIVTEIINSLHTRSRGGDINPANGDRTRVTIVTEERDKLRSAMELALEGKIDPAVRAQAEEHELARTFIHRPALGMVERYLTLIGQDVSGMPSEDIAGRAFNTTSDFPLITEAVLKKRMQKEFKRAEPKYKNFVDETTTNDFKDIHSFKFGEFGIDPISESGEIKHATMSEGKEKYAIRPYGKIISFTRPMIINDDLRFLDKIPQKFSNAIFNREEQVIFGLLVGNPVMNDGFRVFSDDHRNVGTAGTPISVEAWAIASIAMKRHKPLDGESDIEIEPRVLLVPPELEVKAWQFVNTNFAPQKREDINIYAPKITVVVTNKILVPDEWYVLSSIDQVEMIEFSRYAGQTPRIETYESFNTWGTSYRIITAFGGGVQEYRGMFKFPGKPATALLSNATPPQTGRSASTGGNNTTTPPKTAKDNSNSADTGGKTEDKGTDTGDKGTATGTGDTGTAGTVGDGKK